MSMRDAIVGLGMGGPDSEEAIKPFLVNLLSDREIINFGIGSFLQNILARRIASKRSKTVAPLYAKMNCNGGSPQLMHTMELLNKLKVIYEERVGVSADVYAGMCYWHPFISDVVNELKNKGYRNIYFFPLYPQYSCTTTGVCYSRLDKALEDSKVQEKVSQGKISQEKAVKEIRAEQFSIENDIPKSNMAESNIPENSKSDIKGFNQVAPNIIKVDQFYNDEQYLDLVVNDIINTSKCFDDETHLLISAHSLPQSVIDSGDLYQTQIEDEAKQIMSRLQAAGSNIVSYSIGYQSKLGRQKWLAPNIIDELERVVKVDGKKRIVLYAISFINDHIETLVELDDQLQEIAGNLGVVMKRVPTLNADDRFVNILVDLLLSARDSVN